MPPAAPEQQAQPDPWAAEVQHYRHILHELADLGMDFARAVHREATASPATSGPATPAAATPATELAAAFDRIARTIRRTVALAHRIGDPPDTLRASHGPDRAVARTRIIRDVEDSIGRVAEGPAAESMHAELAERLDDPALDDELAGRPIADIIADICHDLGIAAQFGTGRPYWRRRTPQDVVALRARAAQPARGWRNPLRPKATAGPPRQPG